MLNINLLPWRALERDKIKKRFFILLGGAAILSVLFLGLITLFLVIRISQVQQDNNFLQQKIDALGPATKVAKLFFIREDFTQKSVLLINQLEANRDMPTKVLDVLASLPSAIQVTRITYKDNQLMIEGLGDNTVTDLVTQMNKMALFEKVNLSNLQALSNVEGFSQSFTMTATLKVH